MDGQALRSHAGRRRLRVGVSYSAGIGWLKSFCETGSAARGQMGGHRPKTISGKHQDWLVQRCRERDLTLRRLVGDAAGDPDRIEGGAVGDFEAAA